MMKTKIFLIITAFLALTSCKNQKEIAYMQNIEQIAKEASQKNVQSTIQPNDQLLIYVTAKDMSITAPFNQGVATDINKSQVNYSQPNTNLPASGQTSVSGVTYTVYSDGFIEFPILGRISTTGKTVEALKDELTKKLRKYIIDPTVSVRYANYRVTVLGEVNKPGEYLIPDGKTTLLAALGLAGDLTIYGKRDNILVVREQDGVRTQAYINLTDANFINSPYYHLKQNDVVYVTPNNAKKNSASFGPQTTIYISVASIIVTILALIIKK